jgi:hypothetical protein
MAQDLIVTSDRPVVLDQADPKAFREAFQVVSLQSLSDLVKHGLVDSERSLNSLLHAAKAVTVGAMRKSRDEKAAGASWADAERLASFRGTIAGVAPAHASIFWSVVRAIPPKVLVASSTTPDALFVEAVMWSQFTLQDVTIKSGGVLTVSAKSFACRHLVIEKTAKLKSTGSGLLINATSIHGL